VLDAQRAKCVPPVNVSICSLLSPLARAKRIAEDADSSELEDEESEGMQVFP
jgi:hypothetical protein